MKDIPTVMALWREGYFSEEEVIAWADAQILKSKGELSDSLMELSLKGPARCAKLDSYIFPSARKFSFTERFAVTLATLNFSSKESVLKFVEWVSCEAMGEDLKIPEVLFGYLIEEEFCYEEGNPLKVFYKEIESLKLRSEVVFKGIIEEVNA
ncbi:MAG: hypothetical protein EOO07_19980 [Chitinophagaceae bacterium]|nr:MAG: hypothetical protein EOO07_19980 [Chitinophagaceae bacterium]